MSLDRRAIHRPGGMGRDRRAVGDIPAHPGGSARGGGDGHRRRAGDRAGPRRARPAAGPAERDDAAGAWRAAVTGRRFDDDQRADRRRQIHAVPGAGRHLAVRQRHGGAAGRHGAVPAAAALYPARHATPGAELPGRRRCLSGRGDPCRPGGFRARRADPELDLDTPWAQRLSGRRAAAPGAGARVAHPARLAVPGRGDGQPGPGGRGGPLPHSPASACPAPR